MQHPFFNAGQRRAKMYKTCIRSTSAVIAQLWTSSQSVTCQCNTPFLHCELVAARYFSISQPASRPAGQDPRSSRPAGRPRSTAQPAGRPADQRPSATTTTTTTTTTILLLLLLLLDGRRAGRYGQPAGRSMCQPAGRPWKKSLLLLLLLRLRLRLRLRRRRRRRRRLLLLLV